MSPKSLKDEFVNVNKLIERMRNLFRCQVCFSIKDEDSICFYMKCQHFFCSSCISKNNPCLICSEASDEDEKVESGKQLKLGENENILTIFRLLADYDQVFLMHDRKKDEEESARGSSKKNSKKRKNKNDVLEASRLDNDNENENDENEPQKKKRKLNVLKRNHKGESPLHLACRKGDIDLIRELIEAGADPNQQDNAGWTPLHDSIVYGREKVIKLLLKNGACVNTPGHENTTALHQAVAEGKSQVVRLLMSHGANKNARDIYGETPMDLLKKYNLTEIEEIMMTTPAKLKPNSEVKKKMEFPSSNTVMHAFMLNEDETSIFNQFVKQFQFRTEESLRLELSDCYIITSREKPDITWKIIPGVLLACHVIHVDWMKESLTKNSVQTITDYEMTGDGYSGFVKSRENQIASLPKLFSGCHFYFGGSFELYKTRKSNFLKTELKLFVKSHGGIILTRNPDPESLALEKTIPYHARPESSLSQTSYYIIYCEELWDPFPKYNMKHMKSLPIEWLLASIHKFELIDPQIDQSYTDFI